MNLSAKKSLLKWFAANQRPLPWRKTKDPYAIWVSEIMLQQTTSQAVIPYFERFLAKFPTVQSLATAHEGHVLQAWAGLGYYSRARNLQKAAKAIVKIGSFPKTAAELLDLPGFGPYTSRAVSSIAFGENVGVLDGNVIRVLSRFNAIRNQWWSTKGRKDLQLLADEAVENVPSNQMNQALMELGASLCLPRSAKCRICPLMKNCKARIADTVEKYPLVRPRREKEIWSWKPQVQIKNGKVLLVKNTTGSFLKNHWILPGTAQLMDKRPEKYDYAHTITHHQIYVQRSKQVVNMDSLKQEYKWVDVKKVKAVSPASLVLKALEL